MRLMGETHTRETIGRGLGVGLTQKHANANNVAEYLF